MAYTGRPPAAAPLTSGDIPDGSVTAADLTNPLTKDAAAVQTLNRTTSDGDIQVFQKDGTTVGQINSYNGDILVGTDDVALRFHNGNDAIYPFSIATPALRDSAIDIGGGSQRFKNLYLSGGVFLGGTGASNYLDDYEEGTFTATLRGSSTEPGTLLTTTGNYTKIGNKVTVMVGFRNVNNTGYSGAVSITGLPFGKSADSVRAVFNASCLSFNIPYLDIFGFVESAGSTTITFYSNRDAAGWGSVTHNAGANRYLEVNFTYITNT